MRIAIVNLTGGGLSGGYLKYLSELMPVMHRHPGVKELVVFLPPAFMPLLEKELPPEVLIPCQDNSSGRAALRGKIFQLSPDVVFFPTYRWLDIGRIPTVSMIRNMEPLLMPFGANRLVDAVKNLVRAYSARRACRQASRVIAVSHYVKDFLERSWYIPPDKIGVVYHGVKGPPGRESLAMPRGLTLQGVGGFLFTAGSIRPYRGLEDIIEALGLLAAQGRRPPLVIAGAASRLTLPYQKKIEALAVQKGVAEQIFWAGHLSASEMSWCYYHSKIFLMTSRIEACPNVALEAMSHGCLCLAADNPPLPEFFQEAAIYYRAHQADSLASVISQAFNLDPEEDEKLRTRARQQAQKFTWRETAERTLRELELAAGK